MMFHQFGFSLLLGVSQPEQPNQKQLRHRTLLFSLLLIALPLFGPHHQVFRDLEGSGLGGIRVVSAQNFDCRALLSGRVCQILAKNDQSLPELMQINCTIQPSSKTCQCQSPWIHPVKWVMLHKARGSSNSCWLLCKDWLGCVWRPLVGRVCLAMAPQYQEFDTHHEVKGRGLCYCQGGCTVA